VSDEQSLGSPVLRVASSTLTGRGLCPMLFFLFPSFFFPLHFSQRTKRLTTRCAKQALEPAFGLWNVSGLRVSFLLEFYRWAAAASNAAVE
jgi:hypothetical protein